MKYLRFLCAGTVIITVLFVQVYSILAYVTIEMKIEWFVQFEKKKFIHKFFFR